MGGFGEGRIYVVLAHQGRRLGVRFGAGGRGEESKGKGKGEGRKGVKGL